LKRDPCDFLKLVNQKRQKTKSMKAHKKKISCTASIHVGIAIAHFSSCSYEPPAVKSMEEKTGS
jgi:hypothetical protein